MPPKQSATLTEAELRIMDVLWRKGSGTVQQVLDWLPSPLAYNSVLTTIRILERKGLRGAREGWTCARLCSRSSDARKLHAPRFGI